MRAVDLVGQRVEHRRREVQAERELDERLHGDRLVVLLADPLVGGAFDAVLRRARELGLLVEQRLEHGPRVVDAQPDADRHQERQVPDARAPVVVQLALAHHVEVADRKRGREEQRHVDEHHLVPAHVVADDHGREHQHRQDHHQRVVEVRREVEERLGLDRQRHLRAQDLRQQLAARLDGPLRPAVLLRLERVHLDRHFGRRDEIGDEHELPAAQLSAVAQVQVFGQRVVLPAAGVVDRRAAPDAGRPVEVEEAARAIAPAVFEDEMPVEQDRLDLRQQRVVLVDVAPARLHHRDAVAGEIRHHPQQEIGGRDEVGVENRDELAARHLEARFERAGLVPDAVRPVEVLDVEALGRKAADGEVRDAAGLVGRVVEHLDFEPLTRILDTAHRVDQAVRHVHLVVERQLDRDDRQRVRQRAGLRLPVLVPHVEIHEVIPVPAVDREDDQNEKICREREGFVDAHVLALQSFILLLGRNGVKQMARRSARTGGSRRGACRHRARAADGDASSSSIRGSRVRSRRSPSQHPSGLPGGHPRIGQDTGSNCGDRGRNRPPRFDASGHARERRCVRRRASRRLASDVPPVPRRSLRFVRAMLRPARARSWSRRRAPPISRSPKRRR